MTSIDEPFTKPVVSGNKRKLEPFNGHNPNELYKAAKLGAVAGVRDKGKMANVSEEEESEFAGPELPPDFDQGDILDDEEGRFFGGGVGQETARAMDFLDQQDTGDAAPEKIDIAWLRKLATNFEKRISKNAELRAKFEDHPQKFMASEADLDSDIKSLSVLSEHPDLYEEFSKLGGVASLVSLLSHENTDIAINAIQTISELTDEDVETEQAQWDSLVNAALDADLIELLAQNLTRLGEDSDADRAGVYYILSVLENIASQVTIAERIGQDANVMSWLLIRIQRKERPVRQNKQYATEILAILLQSSSKNRIKFAQSNGVDALLQLLSVYRKRDPENDSDEEEYMENLFDCLTCVVDENEGKDQFVEGEGVELAQIMLKEGKLSKQRALRVLDHVLSGQGGTAACERLIDVAGLRTIFGMFMKKQESETIEHLLGIFASLLRLLPGNSAARIRTLAKFVEKDYEKIEKLIKLRREYAAKLAPLEQTMETEHRALDKEDQADMASGWLARRLDAGLFSLQIIDVILAWLVAEDDGAKSKVASLLADHDEDLSLIRRTLQEQIEGLSGEDVGERDLKDMLGTLLRFLS